MGALINLQNLLLEETTSGNGTSDIRTIIAMIILIVVSIVCIAGATPLYCIKIDVVNPEYFKKIKINKKFSKLFVGFDGGPKYSTYGDVTKYGIMIPYFILHLTGYILALLSIIATIIMSCLKVNIVTIAITMVCILGAQTIAIVVTSEIYSIITKKKDKEQNKKGKNHEN